jgi:TonB-dependent starch-binding outer membrane protein SusC
MKKDLLPRIIISNGKTKKILLAMKLFLLLSAVFSFQLTASVYSQHTKFDLDIKDQTIRQALLVIENKSKFKFFYNEDFINVDKVISLKIEDGRVEEVLDRMLEGTDITYSVLDNNLIILKQKGSNDQASQSQDLQGIITDKETGEKLVGVTIQLKGTNMGVISDVEGKFTIRLNNPATDTLIISMVGYIKKEIAVNNNLFLFVALEQEIVALNQVIVIGYGTQKKKDLTGAVSVVSIENISRLTTGGVQESLQGQAAGVSVTSSGDPGSNADVHIRGIGSFSNGGAPLYVIDGVILEDGNQLNTSDIESIQILKDASSASIYGVRGANGVVIITTKHGKEGPARISITTSNGMEDLGKKIEMMNSNQYLYYNELSYINAGLPWPGQAVTGASIANTDWQRALFKLGKVQDFNISASGGSENGTYMISSGYYSRDGIIIGPDFKRYSVRANAETKKGIFTFGEHIGLYRSEGKVTNGGSFFNVLTMPPVIPVYDPTESRGGFGHGTDNFKSYSSNPVGIQEGLDDDEINNRLIGNLYAELEIIRGLKYKLNLETDYWNNQYKINNMAYTLRYLSSDIRWKDRLDMGSQERLNLIVENTLNYTRKIQKHNFEFLLGFTSQDRKYKDISAAGINQKVPGLVQLTLDSAQWSNTSYNDRITMESYLGRMNYNWDEKILAQVNVRKDGSSKFGSDYRWGTFYGGSLGVRLSNFDFFQPVKSLLQLNDFKLRASWGQIGDESGLGPYDTKASIEHHGPYEGYYNILGQNQTPYAGAAQSSMVNKSLRWEVKTTTNIGIDFAFFKNKMSGSVEWFKATSTDLLVELPVALVYGIGLDPTNLNQSTIWTNYGKMENAGWEINWQYKEVIRSFKFNFDANFSFLSNKVLKLGDKFREGGWNQVNRTMVDRSIADFYLLKTNGIFHSWDEVFNYSAIVDGETKLIQPKAQPGDVRYVDFNKDGKIDADDKQWCGSPLPKFEIGLNAGASYKNFDLTMFWMGRFGNKLFNGVRQAYNNMSGNDNISADMHPWTWDNPNANDPRPYFGPTDNAMIQTDRWLENGSFMRLKNLQIAYTIPQLTKKNIQCRINIGVQNLITITQYKGYDPELTTGGIFEKGIDWGQYPPVKTYLCGLQFSF